MEHDARGRERSRFGRGRVSRHRHEPRLFAVCAPEQDGLRAGRLRGQARHVIGCARAVGAGGEPFADEAESPPVRLLVALERSGQRLKDERQLAGGKLGEQTVSVRERRAVAEDRQDAEGLALVLERRAEGEGELGRPLVLADGDARSCELGGERRRHRMDCPRVQLVSIGRDQADDRNVGGARFSRRGGERIEGVGARAGKGSADCSDERAQRAGRARPATRSAPRERR